ncbi:hypothetical protein [Sulfurovum sp. TSL1]|uniref:hypothetical protein n=1 Tax=Sulfurovum sp. TSL1 TaxID=2826994 RepID=UPI001CC5B26C|nr:hypothetical protein [Sulfurovum sp. TSL1]GIT98822.1 hypothetical protein TSL1_16430 [Sulfurovum sp. TSL1]
MTQFEHEIIVLCLNILGCLKQTNEEITKDKEEIIYFENLLINAKKLYFKSTSKKRINNQYHFDLLRDLIEISERKLFEYYMERNK